MEAIANGGADVPTFSVEVLRPGYLTSLSPEYDMLHPASADLPMTWTADSSVGTLAVLVSDTAGVNNLVCEFPLGDGAGVIPAATLAAVQSTDVMFIVWTECDARQDTNRFYVDFGYTGPFAAPFTLTLTQ
jgi:hypothetical protein